MTLWHRPNLALPPLLDSVPLRLRAMALLLHLVAPPSHVPSAPPWVYDLFAFMIYP